MNTHSNRSLPNLRLVKAGAAVILALLLAGSLAGCMAPKASSDHPLPTASRPKINPADLPAFVPGDPANGKTVFVSSCVNCHGQEGKGILGLGSNLVVPSKWMKEQNDAMLLYFLQQGHQPPLARTMEVTDPKLRDVITYMRTIQQK